MSDQAILSLRIGGREIDTYVHDAEGLGPRVQDWIAHVSPLSARAWARDLRVVDPASRPTEMEQVLLMGYADIDVASESISDWYCLMRKAQGDVDAILRSGVAVGCDPSVRPFALWRVLLDLDDPAMEVWNRRAWDGGPVAPFERVGRFSWGCAPGVDSGTLFEAVGLLRQAERENAVRLAPYFEESRRAVWHMEIAAKLGRGQSHAQAERIIDDYERGER